MAEKENKQGKQKSEKSDKPEKEKEKSRRPQEQLHEALIRIFGYDIPSSRNIIVGLTRIKGVSWAISNAVCVRLGLQKTRKISELSKDEIQKIESFLTSLPVPDFMKNRRLDRETGETAHYFGSDLDIKKEFDIKRLKKIKSYKGVRHGLKLPVRGQRTRSHFRLNKKKSGGIKKNEKKA